jgi:hypothetical protein
MNLLSTADLIVQFCMGLINYFPDLRREESMIGFDSKKQATALISLLDLSHKSTQSCKLSFSR